MSCSFLSRFTLPHVGGLLSCACLLMAGCNGGEEFQTVSSADADRAEAHADDHHHEAPHGGHLIELGEHQYNAEVVLEAEPKQLVVYLLDAHAENPVAIESGPLAFTPEGGEPISLEPQPQEGDADGQSSRFVASGAAVEAIADIEEFHGSLKVTIDGTEFAGELAHDHDHEHGHDHGHGDHDHDKDEHAGEKKDAPAEN